ncbi:MAG: antitoxin component YwqK of YwqJK toxin-antitoxin module [Flavobacteriales bacterium]|jgi:antitoxin component YwqK of YwqJK toxin-antitoxin module
MFLFSLGLLLTSCTPTETQEVRSTFDNGQPDEVHIYLGKDSLNRKEIKYYANGSVLSEGSFAEGKKEGLWQSFHLDGSAWSTHTYKNGLQIGDYNVWHRNGNLRISGTYAEGNEVGKWFFITEEGDTARVINYDDVH